MKKIIMLTALFSVFAVTAADFRLCDKNAPGYTPSIEFLERKLQETKSLYKENKCIEQQAKRKLLQTDEGQAYTKASLQWHKCVDVNGFESPKSKDFRKIQESTLMNLIERPEYKEEYLPAITKRDHYANKMTGLVRMRDFAVFQSKQYGSGREAMGAGLESMKYCSGNPSTATLEWTNDFNKTQLEVKEELSDILREVSQLEEDIK